MKKTFQYHKPSELTLPKVTELREAASAYHDLIEKLVPASRERSIALTELESANMWAIKAIVINDPESEAS